MTSQRQFSKAELRYIKVMHDRGKTYADIGFELQCCASTVWNAVHPTAKKTRQSKPKKHKQKPTKTIREILAEPEQVVLTTNACDITCCSDRKSCTAINHPENCLVWQLYHNDNKRKLKSTYDYSC